MQAEGGVPKPCPEPCPQVGNSDLREPGGAAGKTCQPSGTRPAGRNSQAEGRGFETRRPLSPLAISQRGHVLPAGWMASTGRDSYGVGDANGSDAADNRVGR